jgi:LysM repeat protein
MRRIISALLFSISSTLALAQAAQPLQLAEGAPDRYIVAPGDTLWSIASKFLKDPYRWAELWKLNADEIKNPQRIYPGQVISLDKSAGQPRLKLATINVPRREYVESMVKEIPAIEPQVIEPFLSEPRVSTPTASTTRRASSPSRATAFCPAPATRSTPPRSRTSTSCGRSSAPARPWSIPTPATRSAWKRFSSAMRARPGLACRPVSRSASRAWKS